MVRQIDAFTFFIFGILFSGASHASPSDWQEIWSRDGAKVAFDQANVVHVTKNVNAIWLKTSFTSMKEQVRRTKVHEKNIYVLHQLIVDCKRNRWRLSFSQVYSSSGDEIKDLLTQGAKTNWKPIVRKSQHGALFERSGVCRSL